MKNRQAFENNEASHFFEASFQAMFQLSGIGVAQADAHTGKILLTNAKLACILGYSESELLGKKVIDLTHPEDKHELTRQIHLLVSGELQQFKSQRRLLRKDGTIATVISNAGLICNPDGSPSRVISVIEDISDLELSKQALKDSQDQLKLALDASEVGIWVWDVQSGKITWSEKLEKIYGLEPGSFSGTFEAYKQLIHPEDRDHTQAVVQKAIEDKKPYSMEHRVIHPDGKVRWLLGKGKAIYDESGKLVKMTGTSSDITERKLQEENLLKKTQELDRFAAVAAHDLKAPLNSVIEFSKLLGEEYKQQLDSQAHEYIGYIVAAGQRMSRFIDNLLSFARAGETTSDTVEKVCMNNVISEAQNNLIASIAKSKAKISVPHDLPTVFANETQLLQLMQNLLSNAIKYRKPNTIPEIVVGAHEAEDHWKFSVQDNGIGIHSKHLPKLFNFFHRIDPSRTQEGLGIGLAVCKKIVERHRGHIWAESEPGLGTKFIFSLPKN